MSERQGANDHELGAALEAGIRARTADMGGAAPDDDLFARIGRRDRRLRRALVLSCVATLVVGLTGGYAVTRPGGDDGAEVSTPVAAGGAARAPVDPRFGVDGPLERVLSRTVNGVEIRVYRSPVIDPSLLPCASDGTFVVEMWNDRAVTVVHVASVDVGTAGAAGVFGAVEGTPVAWALVDVAAARRGPVRVTFGDRSDEVVPVDGVAALATPLDPLTGSFGATIDADDERTQLEPVPTSGTPARWCSGAHLTAPALPPSGTTVPQPVGPPPADEEAARAAIVQAFVDFGTSSNPIDLRLAAVEDGAALQALLEQARDAGLRSYGPAIDQMTITVHDVRFLDETRALVISTLHVPGHPDVYANNTEQAMLVDGRWVMSRESVCARMAPAGVRCPPRAGS